MSTLDEVARLGREFGRFAERHGLSAEVRFAVNLALEEIVTNSISHGYGGREDGPIRVEVEVGPSEVTARVEDEAAPFDPLRQPAPDVSAPLEQRRVGGLGIYLSRKLLDGLEYRRAGGKNCLELRKRL
jgi:anti-sigma regulatory factor (Ser/Thr protein kinase)